MTDNVSLSSHVNETLSPGSGVTKNTIGGNSNDRSTALTLIYYY
jgi:hypothetical protein